MTSSRDYVVFYVNGSRHVVRGGAAFTTLSSYLRQKCGLTGTKVVCAEGDCGACSVLKSFRIDSDFRAVNSCIMPLFLLDGSHIVTVEGLEEDGELSEIQQAMLRCFGSQCGFCTPGFVVALTDMFERDSSPSQADVKNHLTGNLCRCTGYKPILEAAESVDPSKIRRIKDRYHDDVITRDLDEQGALPVEIQQGRQSYFAPVSLEQAAGIKGKHRASLRIYSGATDLGVRDNKLTTQPQKAMSLHLIPDLDKIESSGSRITVGARASLRKLEVFCRDRVPQFANFLRIFASPQIKESATLIGNLANGSPIADTLPFLFVADAIVHCLGEKGERDVPIKSFFKGYKDFDLEESELIKSVSFSADVGADMLGLYKASQRRDLDISCVNMAVQANGTKDKIESIKIALGGVGPTPLRAPRTEDMLQGAALTEDAIEKASLILDQEIKPISDVRGTSWYRKRIATNLLRKFSEEFTSGS